MVNVGLMPLIMDGRREALGQPDLAVDPTQQERAKVRRQGSTLTISPHCLPGDGGKHSCVGLE